jgi:hypothetical protein
MGAAGSRLVLADDLEGRLRRVLDRGSLDLCPLAGIFRGAAPEDIQSIVRRRPAGVFSRRLWFLYEWLTGRTLDVPAAGGRLRFVPVLDPERQVALRVGAPSGRHRVIDNLPGTRRFCPMVRWTPSLRTAVERRHGVRIQAVIASSSPDRRAAVAARLQRSEAEASFDLAGAEPPDLRIARWAEAIGQAGARVLTLVELLRLQRIVCAGAPPARLGIRSGASRPSDVEDRLSGHAGAAPGDLEDLVGGLIDFAERAVSAAVDPVIAAAALAFGFWRIRPFACGNAHLHRWLAHHIFDITGYTPPGFALPIGVAMVRRLEEYRDVCRYAPGGAADDHRFVDMTRHAEFLYRCLEDDVELDIHQRPEIAVVRPQMSD